MEAKIIADKHSIRVYIHLNDSDLLKDFWSSNEYI